MYAHQSALGTETEHYRMAPTSGFEKVSQSDFHNLFLRGLCFKAE